MTESGQAQSPCWLSREQAYPFTDMTRLCGERRGSRQRFFAIFAVKGFTAKFAEGIAKIATLDSATSFEAVRDLPIGLSTGLSLPCYITSR